MNTKRNQKTLHRGTIARILACVLVGCMAGHAYALSLVTQGNTLFITGPVEDDISKFSNALTDKEIERVVLVNVPGGDLWTGMRIGRMIADKGLATVCAGECGSSGSIIFMGGKIRTFSDAFRPKLTYVRMHGPSAKLTKQLAPDSAAQIYAFYNQQMGEKFKAAIINTALFDMDDSDSATRVFDATRMPKLVAYHCKSGKTPRKDCIEYPNEDAYSLGIVTSLELTHIDLPESFKAVQSVHGVQLNTPLNQSEAGTLLKDLSAVRCKSEKCERGFQKFSEFDENKAIAIPLLQYGYGLTNDDDSTDIAFNKALYLCNHIKGDPPRLCEVQVINNFAVQNQLYTQGEISHAKALLATKVPAEKYYANEEYGGGREIVTELRTEKYSQNTAQSLRGITTLGTQALVQQIKGATPPVVVDAMAFGSEAIPGSVALFYGGFAFADTAAEAAYKRRFEGLLKLLAPDPNRPIVFYALSRDMWHSANAAMRARDLGYTQVSWYRGGLASWKAAGLPVAQVVVRAGVN